MELFTEIVQAVVAVLGILFTVYILYLQFLFLRKGIRFFDHQEEDRNYRQWLARQQDNESKKDG